MRGDDEVNEIKLKNTCDALCIQLAAESKVEQVTGGAMGPSGPVGLKGAHVGARPVPLRPPAAAPAARRATA